MGSFIDFMKRVGDLKKVKRTGWVVQGVKAPESVAEHSYRVTVLCMLLARKFGLDELKLLRMALIHDLAESIVGDIVLEKGSAKVSSRNEKSEKEKTAMKEIFADLEEGDELYGLWMEYEEQSSKEARVLKQLDKIEMVMQALEYEAGHGPRKLDEFWVNAEKQLKEKELIEFFKKLQSLRKR